MDGEYSLASIHYVQLVQKGTLLYQVFKYLKIWRWTGTAHRREKKERKSEPSKRNADMSHGHGHAVCKRLATNPVHNITTRTS